MYRPTHISSSAPTVNDDFSDGFRAGNLWWNTSSDIVYMLEDDSTGAASWVAISSADVGSWDDWTPTITWTGNTPTGVSYIARYITIGDVCYFMLDVSCTTGGSGNLTNMKFTLPKTVVDNDNYIPVQTFHEYDSTYAQTNIAYVDGKTPGDVEHAYFPTMSPSKSLNMYFAGFYEFTE